MNKRREKDEKKGIRNVEGKKEERRKKKAVGLAGVKHRR